MSISSHYTTSLAALRQFVRTPQTRVEKCEMCAATLLPEHQHLLELDTRRVSCSCEPCAILFGGSARQRYHRIPRDVSILRDFQMDDYEWESLLIPIKLAYFVRVSAIGKVVAQYPSPAGAMEASLDLEYWKAIADKNLVLGNFEPDVEALLVNRVSDKPLYFRVPIDQCFRLVGILRKHWRGLSGGAEVWQEVDRYFETLLKLSGAS